MPREGSLCEDLREDAYREKGYCEKTCESMFAASWGIVKKTAREGLRRKAHRERTCVRGVTMGERNDGEKNGRQAEHGVKRGG